MVFFEPNAGHLAIIRALEYGYKDIYIVGIELSDKWEYFYDKEEVKIVKVFITLKLILIYLST